MCNLSPFGMVKTAPDCTMTFAGAVEVDIMVQLDSMVQSPDKGGLHERYSSAKSTLILGKENPFPGSVINCPVVLRADKIVEIVAEEFLCFKMAQAPATAGAEREVPLFTAVPPPGTDEVTDSPGARRVRKEALFVNDDTWSALFVEPTLIALEIHAGALRAFV